MNKMLKIILILSMTLVLTVMMQLTANALTAGLYIIGDGSGGGGGGSQDHSGSGGGGGNGGGDNDDIVGSTGDDIIFGDGSGGGAGGRSVYCAVINTRGGFGGSGNDTITGDDGDDVIFGDGFNGLNGGFSSGKGGLGGGGGGATGGKFSDASRGQEGGIGAGGAGGGFDKAPGGGVLVEGIGNVGGDNGGKGGNSATSIDGITGLGGNSSEYAGGGGGGFGGAAGGTGGAPGTKGEDGDNNLHQYSDVTSSIRTYFTEDILRTVLLKYPNYGAGNDIINGGSGSNELFGLGGSNTFIVESNDASTRNRIWDFKQGDQLYLKTDGNLIAALDVNEIIATGITNDYDGDGNSDDTRLVFSGCDIDLIDIAIKDLINDGGVISIPNTAPVVNISDELLNYKKGTVAVQVDPSGTISDPDGNSNWHNGTLSVQITGNSDSADTIGISDKDGSAPLITVVEGTTILRADDVNIGKLSHINGTINNNDILTITFESNATNTIVQEVMQSICFSTTQTGMGNRTITLIGTDFAGDSGKDMRTVNVKSDSYVANYTAGENGKVTGNTNQIVVDGENGTEVTAVPNEGYHFVDWSDGVDTSSRTDTNVTRDINVIANFAINIYTVTYTAGDHGSITGTTVQSVAYEADGTEVTAVPNEGYCFVDWSDGVDTPSRTDTNVDGNINVTANFAINTHTVTYTEGANGRITGTTVQSVAHEADGIQVIAVPNEGYHFVDWSDGVDTPSRTDTNVTRDIKVTANFAINTYTVTYKAGANGSITGTTVQSVDYKADGTEVTAVPNEGYHFVDWSDGVDTPSRTDANVTRDIKVTANFTINSYTVTYTAGAHGSISGSDSETVSHGGCLSSAPAVTVDSGYSFAYWSNDGGTTQLTDLQLAEQLITANITYTAYYVQNPPAMPIISLLSSGDGYASITWDGISRADYYKVYCNGILITSSTYTVSESVYSYRFTDLTNGVVYSFTVVASDAGGDSERSNAVSVTPHSSSTGGGSVSNRLPVNIQVNGKTENAGIKETFTTGGHTITTVTIDQTKLDQKLNEEDNESVVTIPFNNTKSDIVVGQLTGQIIKNMEIKEAVLQIKTENVTYTLPASQINIENVSEQIGKQVELKDIKVNISISAASQDKVKVIEDTANKNNYQVVIKPVEFKITCLSGSKTVDVSRFNGYVERAVEIPDGVDPSKITTGIILNADGTFSHVPTMISVVDGKYYAKINSLTNSTYSFIWSPKTFKDIEKHWAKDAVNDMASRLVISGTSNDMFEPDSDITRGEFTSIVVQALGLMRPGTGKDYFCDVSKGNLYYDAISITYEYDIISGYGNGKFGPMEKVTREQAMTIIARAIQITKLKEDFKGDEAEQTMAAYGDTGIVSSWAMESIASCIKSGVVSGKDENLIAPKDNITRAEAAAIVQRLLKKSKLI